MFSQTASSRNNFIEDFVRRLGGKQVINVNDIIMQMKEGVKQICGESVNEIETMYKQMKQKVEEATTTMYDMQTRDCNGDIVGPIESSIKIKSCDNNFKEVEVEEDLRFVVCGVQEPYGIELIVNGLTAVKPDEFKKETNTLTLSSGYSKVVNANYYVLGENVQTSKTNHLVIKAILDCSDYLKDAKSEEERKEAIKDCVNLEYRNNVGWQLVYFEKQQLEKSTDYTPSNAFNTKFSNSDSLGTVRRIEIENLPSKCLKVEETKTNTNPQSSNYCKEHKEEIKKELEKQGKKVIGVFDTLDEALKVCKNPTPYNIIKEKVTCQVCFK